MTLDSLSRQDMLKVLDQFAYYLGMNDAATRRISEINQCYTNGYNRNSKRKKIRLILCLLLSFLSLSSTFGAFALTISGEILGLILLVVIISVNAFAWGLSAVKNKKDRINYERFCSGIYGYIPTCQRIANENLVTAKNIQQKYNIQDVLFSTDAIAYVLHTLKSHSQVTLFEATQDYRQHLHNERMYQQALNQSSLINQIRRENQVFYDNALSKLDEIEQLERQRNETLNYAVYWQ